MVRFLPLLINLGLLVYTLIDCARTDPAQVRNLPKPVWVLLIILLPLLGGIGWLIAGRPRPGPRRGPRPGPIGPDDDPEFLRRLRPPRDPDA